MDDSYNNGLGLYLSVFELKIPTKLTSPFAWLGIITKALAAFTRRGPNILILEYGIDHPGDIDEMVAFVRPDISILTAVTPEHMEFMKTLDGVAEEETKILIAAKKFAVYNDNDIDQKYIPTTEAPLYAYGSDTSLPASYAITSWQKRGTSVSFTLDGTSYADTPVRFISEPLIRQLSGAALIAKLLGVSDDAIRTGLKTATPAASRMRLFDGLNDSIIIDDTTNFSPDAGVEALKALKRLPANRHIAVLGNMHELGEYAEKGYSDVAQEFKDLDTIVLVGDLSPQLFGPLAIKAGFIEGETLFSYDTSVAAGIALRDMLTADDIVLVKGPFGGFYLEETVKKLLKNQADSAHLTRQSDFWQEKKRRLFGDAFTQ
jgi:UDP-N-acetylmuramyl pentapeptide synthase